MITVVSGLPRSGTSLMMQILEANGVKILTDQIRTADASNPCGYYEFEKVKSLMKDNSWLHEAEGKAVKVIAQLLAFLPDNFEYKIIFMKRNIEEILASQAKMLKRSGSKKNIPTDLLRKTFSSQLEKIKLLFTQKKNFSCYNLQFNKLIELPRESINELNSTLELELSDEKSFKIIDPTLYRERL